MPFFTKPDTLSKIAVLLFLLVLLTARAIPSYLTGQWPWMNPPPVATLKQLKIVRREGLTLPGWQSRIQQNVLIGGHKWLFQELKNDRTLAILLLLTQNGPKDQPQVEWTDINGFHRWKTDSYRTLNFTVESTKNPTEKPRNITVDTQYFRSWTQQQTFAVSQWYAQPNGGSIAPSSWFLADRKAQLFNRRVPWVAVCIIIPIKALDDIENVRPLATSLSQSVQVALMKEALRF
ncbi:MAG TPA: cyanoexosortase B system-associated protein [Kamptonema sp.]|nr:cyanoexosortase B system-associated protein [Kamptonema sp.]